MQELPPNSRQITTEELLQCIGQLYVQCQIQQRLLAEQSQQLVAQNGVVAHEPVNT